MDSPFFKQTEIQIGIPLVENNEHNEIIINGYIRHKKR